MEYVIPVVLVVLVVAGFVTFMVLNATKKSGAVADAREGAPGIGGDRTPLGDTTQHAGEQTEGGTTASDPEQRPGRRSADPDTAAHVGSPGEGEGAERLEFEGEHPRPASDEERLRREHPRPASDEERLRREHPRPASDEERLRRERPRPASERLADRDA